MGEAKSRKAEIDELKRRSPEAAAQSRQLQEARRQLVHGIELESQNPKDVASLARLLKGMFEEAKRTGNVDPPLLFLNDSVNGTVRRLSDISVACKKGCSHCCHVWVSVSAPEALFIAKIIKQRGSIAIDKVRSAHTLTKEYDFDARDQHPLPCPLLENDVCSIYESRPRACRLAASGDAEICARTYHNLSDENVPMPIMYLFGRASYSVALASGLRKVGLSHVAYEFNAALLRALETDNAEQRWLAGEDIFAGIHLDPNDVFANPQAQWLYEHAFA